MNSLDDVIAAIATPIGEGGLAVIRVSGKKVFDVVDLCFRGRYTLGSVASHTAHFGIIVDNKGSKIDEVVATVFCQPHSYTGETTVEISCHGGIYVTQKILECLLIAGARPADSGEFSKRAFLNGKLDLLQAEAVADLIHAKSEYAHKISLNQLEGRLSHAVKDLRSKLVEISSSLEVELDFAEEGLASISRENILIQLNTTMEQIKRMIDSYKHGRVCRDGFKVVLVGEPNVGKSSIFNYLIDKDRSIVTHIPGTTRDVIEENVIINGMLFRLVDTAGLREAGDIVENEGIFRAKKEIDSADMVLKISDLSKILSGRDLLQPTENDIALMGKKVINIFNKFDLIEFNRELVNSITTDSSNFLISAKSGFGMDFLKQIIFGESKSRGDNENFEGVTVSNIRHVLCLEKALKSMEVAASNIKTNKDSEIIIIDLRFSLRSIENIIGGITSDDILNNIFSKFCIGK